MAVIKGKAAINKNIITAQNGDVLNFKNINLGSGYYYFGVRVLQTAPKGKIEIRRGTQDGFLLGTIVLDEMSNQTNKGTAETFLRNAKGESDICLVFYLPEKEKISVSFPEFFAGSAKK